MNYIIKKNIMLKALNIKFNDEILKKKIIEY